MLDKNKKRFSNSGGSVFAGLKKNAFFDYIPQIIQLQAKTEQMPAKNHLQNLLELRIFSIFSCRWNWLAMMRQILPVRIIQWIFP